MRLIVTVRSKLASECGAVAARPRARRAPRPRSSRAPWMRAEGGMHRSTAACMEASSVTSAFTKRAAPPSCMATQSPASFTSAITTLPPCGGEHLRGGGAEAGAAAGDEEGVVLDLHGRVSLGEGRARRRWVGRARAPTLPNGLRACRRSARQRASASSAREAERLGQALGEMRLECRHRDPAVARRRRDYSRRSRRRAARPGRVRPSSQRLRERNRAASASATVARAVAASRDRGACSKRERRGHRALRARHVGEERGGQRGWRRRARAAAR